MANYKSLLKDFKNRYWKIVFGNNKEFKFEDRLIILTSLVVSFICLVTSVFNYYMGLDKNMVYSTFLLTFVFISFFLIGRFWRLSKLLYYLVTITVIIFLDFFWYFNYGSRGSILTSFLVVLTFLVFVWDTRKIAFVTAFLVINLLGLFCLELENPEIVGHYANEHLRIVDFYFGLFLSMTMMLIFAFVIKRNYIKEYSQARKADELKTAFLANMSHELRTPLNSIVGFSFLMSGAKLENEKKQEFQQIIEANSEYLLSMVEDIIDLSKIEIGELQIDVGETDLAEMFDHLTNSFTHIIDRDHQDVTIQYSIDMKKTVIKADAYRLEQVLRNLIDNAVKFTAVGRIDFGCSEQKGKLTFHVKDTGAGIRKEDQHKIFDRFVKLRRGDEQFIRGTGIGLFLSKQIIELMGGEIWFESDYGTGTTFYFTISLND